MAGSGSGAVQSNTDPNADPGGPKIYRSYGSGCGSGTLFMIVIKPDYGRKWRVSDLDRIF